MNIDGEIFYGIFPLYHCKYFGMSWIIDQYSGVLWP